MFTFYANLCRLSKVFFPTNIKSVGFGTFLGLSADAQVYLDNEITTGNCTTNVSYDDFVSCISCKNEYHTPQCLSFCSSQNMDASVDTAASKLKVASGKRNTAGKFPRKNQMQQLRQQHKQSVAGRRANRVAK